MDEKQKYILIFLVLLMIYELIIINAYRQYRRHTQYNRAWKLSRELNKPLLVIGDPDNGFMGKIMHLNYPCGDVCLDIVGCKKCNNAIKGDALRELKKMDTDSYVIFESCVLEYIKNNRDVLEEMKRVSGDKYFCVRFGPTIQKIWYFAGFFTGESTHVYSVSKI